MHKSDLEKFEQLLSANNLKVLRQDVSATLTVHYLVELLPNALFDTSQKDRQFMVTLLPALAESGFPEIELSATLDGAPGLFRQGRRCETLQDYVTYLNEDSSFAKFRTPATPIAGEHEIKWISASYRFLDMSEWRPAFEKDDEDAGITALVQVIMSFISDLQRVWMWTETSDPTWK